MENSTTPILCMKAISKTFPGVQALSNVNLHLHRGEILGICGENGAGKSTLMNVLSGSIPGSEFEGQMYIQGRPVRFFTPRDSKKCGIEMIQQEINLHNDLSVAENILLGNLPRTRLNFVDWKTIHKQADQALKLVNLNIDSYVKVRNLSTSQQQLLAITKALVRHPSILVLDEPTSALTETEARNLLQIVRDFRQQGISCIYISHKLDELFDVADRILVLRDGFLVSEYFHEHFDRNKIIEDMVGRTISNFYPKEQADILQEVLRVEHLSIPHPLLPGKNLIEDVSFRLHAGEILGLAGLVGSGRSELLSSIFGERNGNVDGKVYLDGIEIGSRSPRKSKRIGIGYLTENRKKSGLVATMDVAGNISLANLEKILRNGIISNKKEHELARGYQEKLSIRTPSLKTSVLKLSGGNQQKVVLAKWLETNPKVLLLDEPTKGIDVGAKVDIYRLMTNLAKGGVGIVLVTSDMPELLAMSDRILVLAQGMVKKEISARDATQKMIMEVIMNDISK